MTPGTRSRTSSTQLDGEPAVHRAVPAPQDHLRLAQLLRRSARRPACAGRRARSRRGRGPARSTAVLRPRCWSGRNSTRWPRSNAQSSARLAFDDVQTTPPCRPTKPLMRRSSSCTSPGRSTSATPSSVQHVPGRLDLGDRRPCRPSSSRRPGRAGSTCWSGAVRMSALSAMKCTPQKTMNSAVRPGRRVAGELERVAGDVGELDDLVALVVVAEDEHPVAERRLGRPRPARPGRGRSARAGRRGSRRRARRRGRCPGRAAAARPRCPDGFRERRHSSDRRTAGRARSASRASSCDLRRLASRARPGLSGQVRRHADRASRRPRRSPPAGAAARAGRRASTAGRSPTAGPGFVDVLAAARSAARLVAGADGRSARPPGRRARSWSRRHRRRTSRAPRRAACTCWRRPSATRAVTTSYGAGRCWSRPRSSRGTARSWSGWAARPPTTAGPGCWPRSAPPRSTRPATRCRYGGAALRRLRRRSAGRPGCAASSWSPPPTWTPR